MAKFDFKLRRPGLDVSKIDWGCAATGLGDERAEGVGKIAAEHGGRIFEKNFLE